MAKTEAMRKAEERAEELGQALHALGVWASMAADQVVQHEDTWERVTIQPRLLRNALQDATRVVEEVLEDVERLGEQL